MDICCKTGFVLWGERHVRVPGLDSRSHEVGLREIADCHVAVVDSLSSVVFPIENN